MRFTHEYMSKYIAIVVVVKNRERIALDPLIIRITITLASVGCCGATCRCRLSRDSDCAAMRGGAGDIASQGIGRYLTIASATFGGAQSAHVGWPNGS